jgi:MFS family permease
MPMTGILSARFGSKPIIVSGALGMVLFLPVLAVAPTPTSLGLALFVFGAALGSLDVAMNIHAVEVEKAARTPLMSGFHALFSIGGFAGALVMTLLLMLETPTLIATLLCALVMLVSIVVATPRLLRQTGHRHGPLFEIPRGIVIILAGLTAITFLVEGAMLDWSALLLTSKEIVEPSRAGFGYVLFAIAMTAGRLCGDRLTARLGDRKTLLWGGIAAVAGFVVLLAPISIFSVIGFLLIGGGASNLVPVLFRRAGSQTVMPSGLAIAAISTTGYAGILVGPAGVGFLAKLAGLPAAFLMLAVLLSLVPLSAWIVTGKHA